MGKRLYVGNLPWSLSDDGLKEEFTKCGTVESARVILNRDGPNSGKSRGFGFVEMSSEDEANKAIIELNETQIDGRTVRVSEAKERQRR